MELSAELFGQIVASVDPDAVNQRNDKRRAGRTALRFIVHITPMDEEEQCQRVQATVRDVSPRGVRIEHRRRIARGEQFLLHLPHEAGNGTISILCTSIYCRVVRGNIYSIGAEFECVPEKTSVDPRKNEMGRIRQSILG